MGHQDIDQKRRKSESALSTSFWKKFWHLKAALSNEGLSEAALSCHEQVEAEEPTEADAEAIMDDAAVAAPGGDSGAQQYYDDDYMDMMHNDEVLRPPAPPSAPLLS